jgi:hypothetical protein
MKVLLDSGTDPKALEELKTLKDVNHGHIIKYYDYLCEDKHLILLLEYYVSQIFFIVKRELNLWYYFLTGSRYSRNHRTRKGQKFATPGSKTIIEMEFGNVRRVTVFACGNESDTQKCGTKVERKFSLIK